MCLIHWGHWKARVVDYRHIIPALLQSIVIHICDKCGRIWLTGYTITGPETCYPEKNIVEALIEFYTEYAEEHGVDKWYSESIPKAIEKLQFINENWDNPYWS